MLFATAAAEEASRFVKKRSLASQLVGLQAELAQAQRDATAAHEEAAAASRAPFAPLSQTPTILLAVAGVAAIGLTIGIGVVGLVLGLAAAGGAFMYRAKVAGEAQRARYDHDRRAAELASAHAAAAERAAHVQHEADKVARAGEEIRPSRSVRAVGRAYLPVSRAKIAGYAVLFDRSGLTPMERLRIPDLAASPEAVKEIGEALDRIADTPMLLAPDESAGASEMTTLQGEERTLKGAVETFNDMVQAIPVFEEELPVLAKSSAAVRYVHASQKELVDDGRKGLVFRSRDGAEAKGIANVTALATRARKVGKHVDAVLRSLHDRLRDTLTTYRVQRSSALDGLHESLAQVLSRSQLPHVRCYCPKCNRVPEYLFHKLGIDAMTAHLQEPQVLVAALQRDPETRERITSDPQIFSDISQAWGHLREVEVALGEWVARQRASAQSVGDDLVALRDFDARKRAMEAQRAQLLEQFRAALRKATTGNPRPLLELSRKAVLELDPERGVWTCTACATSFDDPEVIGMGRMLKVKDELLMPMWNHLWTEKDDFRKSELFRTNEQMQQFIEKEVGALREVGEQYRADMRPVRENLILSTSEAETKREQLDATVESLAVLGVVSPEEARDKLTRLDALSGTELTQLRSRAEAKETLLNQEPQAQMNRRIPAVDPVQVLMGPEALFRLAGVDDLAPRLVEAPPSTTLLLDRGGADAG